MKKNKQVRGQQQRDNTQLIISVLFLVALAVAPLFRGLYHEKEFFLMGAVVLGCCLGLFFLNKKQIKLDYIDGIFLLLCFSYMLSLLNAVNIREAYIGMVKTITYFSCYYIVRHCFPETEKKQVVLKVIVFSLTVNAVLTILTGIGIIHVPGVIAGERFSGTFQYANTFAAAMMLAISLTFYLDLSADQKQKPLYLIINYLNTAAFFTSASRGALLIYVPLLIFYLILWRNKERFYVRLILVNLAALITSVLIFKLKGWEMSLVVLSSVIVIYWLDKIFASLSNRLQIIIASGAIILGGGLALFLGQGTVILRLTQISLSTHSAVARLFFYQDALKIFRTAPFIGHGADSWEYLYRSVQTFYYNTKLVHSNLFQLLVEIGLLGTVIYYSLFVVAGFKNIKAFFSKERQLEAVVLTTLIAVQLHALIDFDLSMPALGLLVFVLLGLLAGKYSESGEEIIKPQIMRIPIILLILVSLISVTSFLIAGIDVDGIIGQVKGGRVPVDKIAQHQEKLKVACFFDPLNADYRNYLGQYIIAEGMEKRDNQLIEEGIKKINTAIKLSPQDYHVYMAKGTVLAQLERYEEAVGCFKQIIGIMPYHQAGYEYLIRTYITQAFGEKDALYAEKAADVYELAEKNFNRIPDNLVDLIPEEDKLINSGMLNFQMGAACFLLEKFEEGLKYFETAQKYIGANELKEEIKGWIAVGNQKLTGNTSDNADTVMIQRVEKLLSDFYQ